MSSNHRGWFQGTLMAIKILFLLIPGTTSGQELIPIGQWRSHFNYSSAVLPAEAGNRIYCAAPNALFYFDREDNSLNRVTRTDGLSDVAIRALAFDQETEWLVIGYTSGNIDVYRDDEIVNLPEILKAQLTGSRSINHIVIREQTAYLSTDFGIVVIDLQVPEIVESYLNLGPEGQGSAVNQSLILGDSLYAATEYGLIAGNIVNGDNLLDFQNWSRPDPSQPVARGNVEFVNAVGTVLIAGDEESLYQRSSEQQWDWLDLDTPGNITWVSANMRGVIVVVEGVLSSFDLASGQVTPIVYRAGQAPVAAITDASGALWVADNGQGLYGNPNSNFENFLLAGPRTDQTTTLYYYEDQVFALHGNLIPEAPAALDEFSLFADAEWTIETVEVENHVDISGRTNLGLAITSFGDGLWDVEEMMLTDVQTPGSPFPDEQDTGLTRLSGLGFDSSDQLWVSQYGSALPYHRRDNVGNWESFSFNAASTRYALSIEINEFDDVWARLDPNEGGGILVFNADTDQDVLLTNRENEGDLPSTNITDIVFDRAGQAWIGTDVGMAFIPNPFNIFDESGFDAIRPIFENGFLLENEYVTSIAVDGGNNKWIGTRKGAWLFNESGEELIEHYTVDNSPLPSNAILDIEINPETGEVFFATEHGLVSVRGRSTAAVSTHQNVIIFPNPVRPGFTGEIGISGLAEDAVVKITDIGGRLIIETNAEGGTATWDGRGFGGNQAESGIYLVFSASPDGEDTYVGKIAIVR